MNEFKELNVIIAFDAILRKNGVDGQEIGIVGDTLRKAAHSSQEEDKTFVLLLCGQDVYCFHERDLFLKSSAPHRRWQRCRKKASDRAYVYAVEITGNENGIPMGHIYELDYSQYCRHIQEAALPADYCMLVYEYGCRMELFSECCLEEKHPQLGELKYVKAQPNDPYRLLYTLWEEKVKRDSSLAKI